MEMKSVKILIKQRADGGAESDLRVDSFGEGLLGGTGLPGAQGWAEAGDEVDPDCLIIFICRESRSEKLLLAEVISFMYALFRSG